MVFSNKIYNMVNMLFNLKRLCLMTTSRGDL